jgi:hypothetical protein
MTEREYVETLREAAREYIDACAQHAGVVPWERQKKALDRWFGLTEKIGAHTVVRMADAWLEKEGADAG